MPSEAHLMLKSTTVDEAAQAVQALFQFLVCRAGCSSASLCTQQPFLCNNLFYATTFPIHKMCKLQGLADVEAVQSRLHKKVSVAEVQPLAPPPPPPPPHPPPSPPPPPPQHHHLMLMQSGQGSSTGAKQPLRSIQEPDSPAILPALTSQLHRSALQLQQAKKVSPSRCVRHTGTQ